MIFEVGMRYRGHLNSDMELHGQGTLFYRDDCHFEGIFNSFTKTATGYLRDKDGELVEICK